MAVAPTSVVMWFLRRSKQDSWLNPLCLTGFHYQNFRQYVAFMTCNLDFYGEERFVMFTATVYNIFIESLYTLYTYCQPKCRFLPIMERESKGPLIDTTNNRKAKKRRIYELQEDHLQLAYNCTLAPNPITIGSMGTETTNSFHQSYGYTLYISSLYILYIMFTVSLYHESDIITSAVNGESKVGWIGMP